MQQNPFIHPPDGPRSALWLGCPVGPRELWARQIRPALVLEGPGGRTSASCREEAVRPDAAPLMLAASGHHV